MIKNYKTKWLKADVAAGFTVAAVGLPQTMAYALIAGVNPIYGLYTSIIATIVATFVGVSNHMIVGPTNIMALAVASSLNFLEPGNYLAGVVLLTMMVGIIQIALGMLKLGNLVNFVSQPVIAGLTTGVAMIIGVGQLSNLLGLNVKGPNLFTTLYNVVTSIQNTNYYSLLIGVLTILIIVGLQKLYPRLPAYLIAVIISILIVYLFNLDNKLMVVKGFSSSLPRFSLVKFDLSLSKKLFSSALSIAILGFIHVLSVVKALEKKTQQEVELNKEFIGQGIINIFCSFFRGFAVAGSFTKSFANYEVGAKTRISELVAGITILLFVVILSPVVKYISISTLAAIVMLIAYNMFDEEEIIQSFKTTHFDAAIFLSTFITTILSPRLDYAVYFGIIVSLILVLKNTSRVDYTHIRYDQESENNFTRRKFEDVKNDKFIVINLAGNMHFNVSENLKKKLSNSFKENKVFVLRMRDITNIDITTIQELDRFIDRVYKSKGEVIISGVSKNIYNCLADYGIVDKLNEENIFRRSDDFFSSTKNAIEKAEDDAEDDVNDQINID